MNIHACSLAGCPGALRFDCRASYSNPIWVFVTSHSSVLPRIQARVTHAALRAEAVNVAVPDAARLDGVTLARNEACRDRLP